MAKPAMPFRFMRSAAKSATIGVGRASVHGHKESVAVNAKGVTIYELGPETSHHLVCKSADCFAAWPPVKAKGAVTKMAGVTGKLGTIKRDGFEQVTLNGKPCDLPEQIRHAVRLQ